MGTTEYASCESEIQIDNQQIWKTGALSMDNKIPFYDIKYLLKRMYANAIPESIRNNEFHRIRQFADLSDYWTESQWNEYQWQAVSDIIRYAYKYVPYYHELFDTHGITCESMKDWRDFKRIPILTKELAQENVDKLLTTNKRVLRHSLPFATSGSTGTPLNFFTTKHQVRATRAYMDLLWSRIGYRPSDTRVIVRGIFNKEILVRTSYNTWSVSTHGVNPDTIRDIYTFLNRKTPQFIHAYPSSLYLLTKQLEERGLSLDYSPKGILFGSEAYPDSYRKYFERYYGCRTYSWLGLAEGTILAGECEKSTLYHVLPGYSYVEMESDPQDYSGDAAIIGTSFHNLAFPFIRYDSGDRGQVSADCSCGRANVILKNVIGRDSEYLVDKDGNRISITAIYAAIHSDVLRNVAFCQFHQAVAGEVELYLEVSPNFSKQDEHALLESLTIRSGNRIKYTPIYDKTIIKQSSGKIKLLISDLNDAHSFGQEE